MLAKTKMDLYDSIRFSLTFSSMFGLSSLQIKKIGNKRKLIRNNWLSFLTVAYITIYSTILFLFGRDFETFLRNYTRDYMINLTNRISIYMQIFNAYVIYLCSLYNMKGIKEILGNIYKIDVTLKKLGHQMNYVKSVFLQIFIYTSLQALQFTLIGIEIWNNPNERLPPLTFTTTFLILLPLVLQNVMESQYILFATSLHQRFKIINEDVKKLYVYGKKNKPFLFTQRLNILMHIHEDLCNNVDLISDAYGLQIFSNTVIQFEMILISFFTYLYSETPINSIISLGWTLLKITEMARRVICCHITSNQANSTSIEVHSLIPYQEEKEIIDQLIEFSQQLLHRQMRFTAWGLFAEDSSLLHTVLSMEVTFLLLLYEFYETFKVDPCMMH